jgi:phenylacetate-CoA ligase
MSVLRTHLTSQALYDATPRVVQAVLANLEAWRRDRFRRYGNYRTQLAHYDPRWYATDLPRQVAYQVEQVNALVHSARRHVPHYRRTLPDAVVHDLADLPRLPVLEKETIRHDPLAFVKDGVSVRNLWSVCTSGSTGTPLRYYHDRTATRAHQAVADALMAMHGCVLGEPRVRFSGACVARYEQRKPPFWIYIRRYRQLQCSAYHLEPGTYSSYLEAMRRARVRYGTGYATAWHLLAAYILESSDRRPALKATAKVSVSSSSGPLNGRSAVRCFRRTAPVRWAKWRSSAARVGTMC